MITPTGFLTIKDANCALMQHVMSGDLASLDEAERMSLMRSKCVDFLRILHAGLEGGEIGAVAVDQDRGDIHQLPPAFWRIDAAFNALITEQCEIAIGYSVSKRGQIFALCQVFIKDRLLSRAMQSFNFVGMPAPKITHTLPNKEDLFAPSTKVGSELTAPRKRGPKAHQHERICAEMRLMPARELDEMLYKQMEARFGAVASTCEIARKTIQAERTSETSPISNNR